ncbi:MAG: SET domain-containing protein-lysine N-methyltransferase [candidate division WWE3 bacterium]|nr:SET domain-containing protein-lysine N-methyltransferase [candidate division WWE3 bacterium]
MNSIYPKWPVYVGWSETLKCRGMFASSDIKKGEVIEKCPLILIKYEDERKKLESRPSGNIIDNYYYDWDDNNWCLPLGYAMLYNHSYQPNAEYVFDYTNELLVYVAVTDIAKESEILVNYNGFPEDQNPIDSWFKEYDGRNIV